MKKRVPGSPPSSSLRRILWLLVTLSAFLCISCLISLHSQPDNLAPAVVDSAHRLPSPPFLGTPKIAFLFLARSHLPLDFLWQHFFRDADAGKFSIYIHSKPGFVFDESTTGCAFFYGRQLRHSVVVAWGEVSMVLAERLLLGAALKDPANQRFILLSDSCVPLYNFSYAYDYVMPSSKSFVDSFLDKEGRYNPKMSPSIPKDRWRKGSQWIALVRKHAEVIVGDDLVFPIFQRHCQRRTPPDEYGKLSLRRLFRNQHNCVPDEHYVPTLLAMGDLEDELERRTLTYTKWDQFANTPEGEGWHPITFNYSSASPEAIKAIKDIDRVYYDTEYRTEWCRSNDTSVPCFLFARKFSRGAAARLLTKGVIGSFKDTELLFQLRRNLVPSP